MKGRRRRLKQEYVLGTEPWPEGPPQGIETKDPKERRLNAGLRPQYLLFGSHGETPGDRASHAGQSEQGCLRGQRRETLKPQQRIQTKRTVHPW